MNKRRAVAFLSILAFLLTTGNNVWAGVTAGKKVFGAKKCGGCHYTAGPAKEKSIADQLKRKGPELWYAGNKFQKEWLGKWLQDPKPIRPMAYNSLTEENQSNHDKMSVKDAAAVTDYLMTLTTPEVKPVDIKIKRKNLKGKNLFIKKMPCYGCHQYISKKKVKGGKSGPSLVGASKRLQADWIYAYLNNTKHFKPVRMMPVFSGLLKDKEIKQVVAYIMNDFDSKKRK